MAPIIALVAAVLVGTTLAAPVTVSSDPTITTATQSPMPTTVRSNAYDCPVEWISDFITREGVEYCNEVAGYGDGCLTLCRRDWLAEYNAHHERKMNTEPSIITFSRTSSVPTSAPTSTPQTPQFPQLVKRENATEFRQRMAEILCIGKWWCLSKRNTPKKPTVLPQVPARIPRVLAKTTDVPPSAPQGPPYFATMDPLADCPVAQIYDTVMTGPVEACAALGKPYRVMVCQTAWAEHHNNQPIIESTRSTFKAEQVDA